MTFGRMAAALTLAAAALTGAGAARAATVIAESRFDTGAEGWRNGDFTVGNTTYDLDWNAGGFVTTADEHDQFNAFLAPATYLGDRRDARGGVLSFDLASAYLDVTGNEVAYVTLRGGGVLLYGLLRSTPPGDTFSRFQVVLTAENFRRSDGDIFTPVTASEFDQVLGNLSQLSILADIAPHPTPDFVSLDNVVLAAGGAVPEPSTWAIMILGLGFTGAALRLERRSERHLR